ncbi:YycH family regulatory protein [Paucilactobacillus kaifaensis]|uniref:YycH family regulatory protein n=1 Tax=Paucilactobacillus kaifaensis TaxID=2559921 RepID=UPI001485134F|nr:two-component system activity regulator YycH [Paucilactobacillus kaifaensis]
MIRRIRDNWLPILLTIAVLISLVLSWFIWTNPARYERGRETDTSSQSQLASKSISDIFLPTQVIKTNQKGSQYLLHAKKVNLVLSLKQKLNNWKLGNISRLTSQDQGQYKKYLMQKNTIALNYPSQVSTTIFNKTFGQSINKHQLKQFNRIIIPLKNTNNIYLLSDKNMAVYRVHVSKHPQISKIKQLVNSKTEQYSVREQLINNRFMLTYPKSISMPSYSYLMNKQSANSFMTTLLNSVSSSAVTVHKKDHVTTYANGSNKRMLVNTKNGTVSYENFGSSTKGANTINGLLTKSFQQLSGIGVPLENIRYDHSNLNQRKVIYRGYVESFPIFNQTEYGAIQIKYLKSGEQKFFFSLYSLQVPVPNGAKRVELPSTKSMLNQLGQAGIKTNKIKNIRLAYEWQTNKDSSMVIDLKPTYYVYYQGKWKNYATLINQ